MERITFASLPQADRDRFNAWKAQAIKDCAWEQAFPSLANEFPAPSGEPYTATPYVDITTLRAAQGGPVLAADGRLVLLGAPPHEDSDDQDDRVVRVTVNGHSRELDVHADRINGTCIVTLASEELFHSDLPRTVPVVASYDPAAPVPAPVDLPAFIVAASPGAAMATFSGDGLIHPALAALAPSDRAYAAVTAKLAISEAQARALFPLASAVSPDAGRVIAPSGITPFAPLSFAYGSTASVQSLYGGGPVEIDLLYRGLGAGLDAGLGDGLVALKARLSVAAGGTSVTVVSIAADHVPYDDAAVRQCFLDRAVASRFEPSQPRSPAFDDQYAGCGALAIDGYAALAGDPAIRQLVATKAIGLGVTRNSYRGWDGALIQVAVRMDSQGVALSELDPSGALTDLSAILGRLNALRGTLGNAAQSAGLTVQLIDLVFGWYFGGLQPSDALVASIATALGNTAADYPTSAETMLSDLGDDLGPTSAGARAAQCGAGITGDRRAQLAQTLTAVDQVPFADSFALDQRANVLQTCPAAEDLSQLAAAAAAAGPFITTDQTRAASSIGFPGDAEAMIDHALTEHWSSDSFSSLGDLLGFSVIATGHLFCSSYTSWTQRALCVDSQLALFSTGSHGILAPSVVARYVAMARELTQRWPAIDRLGVISVEIAISSAWDAALWRGCSDAGFASAKQRLYALLDMLPGATISQGIEIEDQIDTLVDSQTCS